MFESMRLQFVCIFVFFVAIADIWQVMRFLIKEVTDGVREFEVSRMAVSGDRRPSSRIPVLVYLRLSRSLALPIPGHR